MTRFFKHRLKAFLQKWNRRLVYLPQGTVSGVDLSDDLRLSIETASPVCLDVGANEGQTIELLRRTFPKPVVHAFEPSPKMFRVLQSTPARADVFLRNCAMGKAREQLEFINYENSHLSSFLPLDPHEENRFRSTRVESKELVAVDTVDHYLTEQELSHVDLLKVDTQGFDLEVLLGAIEALRQGRIRHVLIELNFVRMYEGQCRATDVVELLAANQFRIVDFYEKVRQNHAIAWCTALFKHA